LPSGFAATPASFAVPAPRCADAFDAPAGNGAVGYTTMDVTGDGHADLVVYEDACDATVGKTHWDVYAWSSAGFDATPAPFTVPAPRCADAFDAPAGNDAVGYTTMDLTGDGHPDLVVYDDTCDATVGQTHWDVYAGGASGFAATPAPFAVPAPRCQDAFDALAGDDAVGYALLDLTGDGRSDLVVYQDSCDATVGQTHWDVYASAASGFAATPTPFDVPAARCKDAFDAPSGDDSVEYTTMDLTGDGHLDLVVTQDTCDATVGQTHWDVYAGAASGFASTPAPFTVPAPRCKDAFDGPAGNDAVDYAMMDLTGDGHLGLVVTEDTCDATVGQTHWDVYAWSASGFAATPSPFTVPAPRCKDAFDAPAGNDAVDYTMRSVTGACTPDLVVTQDSCDATVGQTHWDVYTAK
jgi:hypothetical protein